MLAPAPTPRPTKYPSLYHRDKKEDCKRFSSDIGMCTNKRLKGKNSFVEFPVPVSKTGLYQIFTSTSCRAIIIGMLLEFG